ncbi:Homeodomain [Mactra antiquata]
MHENILQSVGNRQQFGGATYNYSSMEDIFGKKTSAVVQPMSVHETVTPEKENVEVKLNTISPVLPGTACVTHNITRILNESHQQNRSQLPSTATRATHYTPYSTSHFMSFRHKLMNENLKVQEKQDNDILDVGHESPEHLRTGDVPNLTDSSISTVGSSSPQSTGTSSSPSSTGSSPNPDGATSPDTSAEQPTKKKARTNYTNDQVQALLKIFHENPYPDSEMMENIGKDLGIPENKIKIWFQNKRARWRRRVSENMNTYPQPFLPVPAMMSPVAPYGFMPPSHMMTSSPSHPFTNFFNYPWMQGSLSPNNNQHLQNQISTNQNGSRLPPTNQGAALQNSHYPSVSVPPSVPMSSPSSYSMRTSPPHMMQSQQSRQSLQYPFLYGSSNYIGNQ